MSAIGVSSGIFRDIFSTEPMRRIFAERKPDPKISRHRGGAGPRPGTAQASSRQDACDEILPPLPARGIRFRQAEGPDRADRLPGAAGGAAARGDVPRRSWRVVPLGRHHPGYHRYRHLLQIREALDLVEAESPRSRTRSPASRERYRDTPMAGRSNLQQAVPITFGYKCATLLAGFERHRQRLASCGRACWSASSAAPPARWPRSATAGWRCRPR